MGMKKLCVLLITLSPFIWISGAVRSKKSVIASLRAQWPQTSFIAESSEFVAEESSNLFWNYIDQIVDKVNVDEWNTYSDAKQHDVAVRLASELLDEPRTKLLKFALSLRARSPVVQLFQKLGDEKGSSCAAFADVHGTITCDPNDLETLVKKAKEIPTPTLYSIDHIFPGIKETNITVIVYGELATAAWRKFHIASKALSRNGKAKYIFRHYAKEAWLHLRINHATQTTLDLYDIRNDKLQLSGYGVELAIKSTEYKAVDDSTTVVDVASAEESPEEYADNEDIDGFNFNTLRKLHGDLKESIDQFRLHLLEREELTPLKVWQVQELSYQAAQRIVQAGPQKAVGILTNASQNFPLAARSLSRQMVQKELISEVAMNQEQFMKHGLSEGDSLLSINGINVEIDSLDAFHLLDLLRQEEKLANGFFRLGIKDEYFSMLMDLESGNEHVPYALDFRPAFPEYLNNLDTDKQYRQWANSVGLLLQPYIPGMIRPIARNFFTLVFVVDPSQKITRDLLQYALRFYAHEIPIRLGVVFVANNDKEITGFDDASVAMLNLYNFVKSDSGIQKAMEAVIKVLDVEKDFVTPKDVLSYFEAKYADQDVNDVFGSNSDYDTGRSSGRDFLLYSGLNLTPKVLLNGVVLDDSDIVSERFEEAVMVEIMHATQRLQKAILAKKLKDKDNVMDWILSQPEVMPRMNKLVLDSPTSPSALYLDLTSLKKCTNLSPAQYYKLPPREFTQCMLERMRYITRTEEMKTHLSTVWVVTDLETAHGRLLAYNVIKYLKQSHTMRVSIINNPKDIEKACTPSSASMLVNAASRVLIPKQMKSFITKLVKEEIMSKVLDKQVTLDDIAVNGMNMTFFHKESKQLNCDEIMAGAKFSQNVLHLKPGQLALVVNGLLMGPLNEGELLDVADMELVDKLTLLRGGKIIGDYMKKWKIQTRNGKSSDMVARIMALIGSIGVTKKRRHIPILGEKESVVRIPGSKESGLIHVLCIVDPLSKEAQRLGHLLSVVQKVVNVDVKLVMNPKAKLSELPLKRFYRLVLQPTMIFDDSGRIADGAYEARFTALPNRQLLTLTVVPPDAWMVQSVYAIYDLDNIKLENVEGNVIAKFELEHILLEGHCFDDITGMPPRGLQFTLGTQANPILYDTIVMANLGYFQLKASPGAWILKLRDGKSKDIYDIVSHINTESEGNSGINVLIGSFTGRTIRVRVAKKKGKEEESLLSEGKLEEENEEQSLWSSISTSTTGGEKYDTINIFSLASGHLYERFLRIMILSVMKHTKYPVKFWLLKNYLSPIFKETLPQMAEYYGFEYELVEYRWPRWLHQQTEKQRVMWGYKILFLDVLFPLNVRKIIFVDADQIVRTDLMELMELDLGGAPYGFTPFCDSRESMDGFRFWKKGYWASHLAGRKYHISALYVIDLVKFRQVAAGDRLRGQYQGLSADPNSLSNLDQDLPNNMIHQVRIKSLPQEWLWCETWCDDASKDKAKTIDLCNNPQTKEPKLDSAIRIIPEWKDYDTEIKALLAGELTKKSKEEVADEHTEL